MVPETSAAPRATLGASSVPSLPALIPATTSEANRHKRPWKDSSRTMLVPLIDVDGVQKEGMIRVPVRLCRTQEHTNERLEFDKLIRENIERWVAYRERLGWTICPGKPKVRGPFDPPSSPEDKTKRFVARAQEVLGKSGTVRPVTTFDHAEEINIYMVSAYFKRSTPSYVKLEDMLAIRDLHRTYGMPFPHETIAPIEEPTDTGWVNANDYAAARRKRLGLRREDYLMGKLSDPL